MNESKNYGDAVREAIKQHGMSQTQFGELVGWSQSIVSDLVRGERALIPPDVVRTIADTLGISVRRQMELLGYLDPEQLEPGVVMQIRKGDDRLPLLRAMDRMTPNGKRRFVELMTPVAEAFTAVPERQGNTAGA